jgi:hypothetical protein
MSAATAATLATVASIGTIASVAAGALTVASVLTAKKPTAQASGSQTQFSADPDAGIPLVIGRTGNASDIVFRRGWDTADKGDNDRQAFVAVHSLGPIDAIERFTVDKSQVTFNSAGQAIGAFAGFMWMVSQLGATPEPSALSFGAGAGSPPGWTTQHKLSGKAASAWTLRFDTKAKLYQNGPPAPMWTIRGIKAYDPRKDSTYPGGSGPHRMADPSDTAAYDAAVDTWEWTEDPYLIGLRWAHGIWQRDRSASGSVYQRVMGMGAPWETIDVPAFVEGANVAQANVWKVGGVIYSGDGKWDSMKKILQAGMGEPLTLGARISCLVNAPKVSLATVTVDDLVGPGSVAATQPRRDRINTITPRFRLEENNWQLLPAAPISVPAHVAEDRGKRSRVQDYPFIQQTKQAAVAARYDIENAREFGPISLPLKLVWMGYKPGDCVTAILPELGLNGQPILLLNRELSPATGIVTMTARSETAGKHPFALGQTTTPPPTPGVSGPPLVPVPGSGSWSIVANKIEADGAVSPAIVVAGATDAATAEAVVIEYRRFVSGQSMNAGWLSAGTFEPSLTRHVITGVEGGTAYEVGISYQRRGVTGGRLIVGPSETGWTALDFDNVTGPNKPENGATVGATPEQVSLIEQVQQEAAAAATAAAAAQTQIAEIEASIGDLDLDGLNDQVAAIESGLSTAQGNISALQSTSSAVQQGLSTLQGDVTGLQNQASSILSTIGQIGTEVDQLNAAVVTQGGSILTLQQSVTSIDGSVSTLRQQVRAGGNLLTNTDFAVDTSGWTFNNVGQPGAIGGRDLAGDAWRLPGGHNISITQPNANAGSYAEWTQKVPVISGAWYEFSSRVAAHRCAAEIILQWLDANGQWINPPLPQQSIATYPQGGTVLANWFHAGVKGQAPTGAASAVLYLRKYATNVGTTDSYAWFCQPMFRPSTADAAFPSAYSPGSAQASIETQAQAISTANGSIATLTTRVGTAEANISSNATAISTANGNLASLTTRVGTAESNVSTLQQASSTQAGQIATLQQSVSTQGASITSNSQAITTLQGSVSTLNTIVTASSSPNLVPNGGFENDLRGWSSGSGNWGVYTWAWGRYAEVNQPYTNNTGSNVFFYLTSSPFLCAPGPNQHVQSFDYELSGTGGVLCYGEMVWLNSDQGFISQTATSQQNPKSFDQSGNTRVKHVHTAPTNAAYYAQSRFVIALPPGATLTGGRFRQMKVELGSIATPYSGEATAAQMYTAYADLNSSFASLSTTVSSQGGSITTLQQSYTSLNGTVSSLSSTVSAQGSSISSLQSVSSTQSGQIATLQTQVTAGGGNLLQNTDFAVGSSAWAFGANSQSTTGEFVVAGAAWALSDENALRISQPNGSSSGYADFTQQLTVQENVWYDVSARIASHRCAVEVIIQWFNGSGTAIAADSAGPLHAPGNAGASLTGWFWYSFKRQAPAGTTRATFYFRKYATSSGQGDSYAWFCRPQVVETRATSASPLAYSPGSARSSIAIQAQAISTANGQIASLSSTVSAHEASINSQATAISTLQGQQASLSSTVSTQGAAISILQTATSTLQGDTATLRTQVTAGNPNLLRNGGFEMGNLNYWNPVGGSFFAQAGTDTWGTYAASNANVADGSYTHIESNKVGIEVDWYTMSADVGYFCTGSGLVYLELVFWNNDTFVSQTGGPSKSPGFNFSADGSTRRFMKVSAQAPGSANKVSARVVWYKANGVSQSMHVRQVKLERGQVATPYSGEASARQSFEALSTLTSQYASLSSTVSTLNSSVSVQQTAINNLLGKTAAWWSVEAVAGGRAQLRVWADAVGGGGVDIIGDLRVTGNALIGGTVNPEALALDRFMKKTVGGGTGTPAAGQSLLIYTANMGQTLPNGVYSIEFTGTLQTNVGRSTGTIGNKPSYVNRLADGGIRLVVTKGSTIVVDQIYTAAEWITATSTSLRATSFAINKVVDPDNDTTTGDAVVAIYAIRGSVDTGQVDNGDYYQRDISAEYVGVVANAKVRWTFI